MGVVAVVVRDDKGVLIDGSAFPINASSALQGELEAIRKACFMARDSYCLPVTIESDKKQAISISVSELVPPWEVHPVVTDIRDVGQQIGLNIVWAKTTANKVAHQVAALALKKKLPLDWVPNPPATLLSLIPSDVLSLISSDVIPFQEYM